MNKKILTINAKASLIVPTSPQIDFEHTFPYYKDVFLPYWLFPGRSMMVRSNEEIVIKKNQVGMLQVHSNFIKRPLLVTFCGILQEGFKDSIVVKVTNLFEVPVCLQNNVEFLSLFLFTEKTQYESTNKTP